MARELALASTSSVFSRAFAFTGSGNRPNESDICWSERRMPRPVPGDRAQHVVEDAVAVEEGYIQRGTW